ncbi:MULTISPECIES: DUF4114 domain-containing protein [Mesonia]|uniref:Uncharacterized protein n=1 Tax=Mesonia oceanica TaxID=2687242 RepID=A0AC61Y6P3_9FLAO|nr:MULTISPECIES: DUF4114 domain-containing protein [Mesonia]MAN27730.1 hypothetical protein [Mesonia sp.]MAQ39667.1 hypothetical protein [Mesonia sp.]VVU99572.1 hypothetical protein FVB9532_00827 [Mesonia oceanica]|tara:strand:- start:34822 stop:37254 length:2433 start_codon:yes stop_codon:yes gene_type:complete
MKIALHIFLFLVIQFCFAQNYNFLGPYTSDGTPLYLEPDNDVISDATMEMITNAVPEGYPVPDYNPHYISSGYDTDVILDQAADVWVTFVKEGAGYKNVLGFYTYDLNSPYTSAPTPSDITIIFPNVSEGGYGGGLMKGNKVKIGSFPANTGIGWVLLADGWKDATTSVTAGNWQLYSNPDFNPEANAKLRHHNILLADPENERIILGFEDIRRDYSSCDNDFNDALFYVSANPYSALRTQNYADVESATDVSSANMGGLESNGSLAQLIAKRNFNRVKNNSFAHKKNLQTKFQKNLTARGANSGLNLGGIFPSSGMFGSEQSYESSPTDLLSITNATEVFAVDYYEGDNRVAAALATKTLGEVYNHSKMICDRLNGSTLKDIRTVNIQNHELVMLKIERANEQVEYAILFSVAENTTTYELHSYWNIFQYPSVDFANFQIWGSSMGQVSHITNHILEELNATKPVNSSVVLDRIPSVFVTKGFYKDGEIQLEIVNKSGQGNLQVLASKRETEMATETSLNPTIALSGSYKEDVVITTGGLFDINLTLLGSNSPQADALYLADGPWGLDYLENEVVVNNFEISAFSENTNNSTDYTVERNPSVSGSVLGTANLFRTILPGEMIFDASAYESLAFSITNNLPVEIVLVTENLMDWNNRFKFQLPVNAQTSMYQINLSDFQNANGESLNEFQLKSIVFSVQGNYQSFQEFNLDIANVQFSSESLSLQDDQNLTAAFYAYPNPVKENINLVFTQPIEKANLQLFDMLGRKVLERSFTTQNNQAQINLSPLKRGIYQALIIHEKEKFSYRLVME